MAGNDENKQRLSLYTYESDLKLISQTVYQDSDNEVCIFAIADDDAFKFICLRTILDAVGFKIQKVDFDGSYKLVYTDYPMERYMKMMSSSPTSSEDDEDAILGWRNF